MNTGRGPVNHSCGSGPKGKRFKRENLAAVALVASPPAGKSFTKAWQRLGKGVAMGWQMVGKGVGRTARSWQILALDY